MSAGKIQNNKKEYDERLYAKVPVMAYNLLGDLKQYQAQKILACLCSYMDFDTYISWPGYKAIARRAGISKNSIRKGLDVLEELGFVKVSKRDTGGLRKSNQYLVKYYAYRPDLWNWEMASMLPKKGRCIDCAALVNLAQYETGPRGKHVHLGCGGRVVLFTAQKPADRPILNQPPV